MFHSQRRSDDPNTYDVWLNGELWGRLRKRRHKRGTVVWDAFGYKRPGKPTKAVFKRLGCPTRDVAVYRLAIDTAPIRCPEAKVLSFEEQERAYRNKKGEKTYFILCHASGHIKIGKAVNPQRRLDSLLTGAAAGMSIIGVLNENVEQEMHARFARYRQHREWFRCGSKLSSYLTETFGFDPAAGASAFRRAARRKKINKRTKWANWQRFLGFNPDWDYESLSGEEKRRIVEQATERRVLYPDKGHAMANAGFPQAIVPTNYEPTWSGRFC